MEKQSAAVSLSSLKSWPWDAREVLSPGTGQACSPQALQQAQPSALKYLQMLQEWNQPMARVTGEALRCYCEHHAASSNHDEQEVPEPVHAPMQ